MAQSLSRVAREIKKVTTNRPRRKVGEISNDF